MGKTNIPITKTRSYNVSVAADVGINAAVLFENICFWVEKNKANKKNFINGTYWTYNSINAFVELFPEMTYNQIDYALRKLKDKGYIKWASLNEDVFKRTKYYTVCDFDKWILHTDSEEESGDKSNEQEEKEDNSNSNLEISETILENKESSSENHNMFNIYNNINNNSDNYIADNNNTDNDSNSLSKDKDNSKPKGLEIYNSPVPEKQESRISMTLGIKQKQSKEVLLKDMPTRAREIADRLVDDKKLSEGIYDCIEYFSEKYKAKNRKEHLPLRNDTLQGVVEVMLSTLTVMHDEDLENMYESSFFPLVSSMSDWEDRKEVIDKYFETDFREKCDYSLVHFTHKDVITHVMQKCHIGNDINWYDNIPY